MAIEALGFQMYPKPFDVLLIDLQNDVALDIASWAQLVKLPEL